MQKQIHKAKKSLGQNFLKGEFALRKIIEAGEIKKSDVILEIGPGRGALTHKLLETRCKVLAIEKDGELCEFLKIKFEKEILSGQLNLILGDILKWEIGNYKFSNYKVIANIPYNITGAILKKFLTAEHQPELMVLMIQHEVAQRIVAQNKKESLLSISVKAYGEPKMVMKVDKRYFSPQPKVNSAIIAIKNISRDKLVNLLSTWDVDKPAGRQVDEIRFWEIVKAGFAHKRKKLSSNLKQICQSKALADFGNKRAENLTLADWVELASSEGMEKSLLSE